MTTPQQTLPNNVAKTQFHPEWLGLVSMAVAQELQAEVLKKKDPIQIHILACEHEPVLSVGRSLWKDYDKSSSVWENTNRDLDIYLVSRGGKLTIHNPGQLVIYPIMNIKNFKMGIKDYLYFLFSVTQKAFASYGLNADIDFDRDYGMYVEGKKIVSAGLSYSEGWVSQGLSINLCNELEVFKTIDVCGRRCMQMTSAKALGFDIKMQDFFETWMQIFTKDLESKNSPLN